MAVSAQQLTRGSRGAAAAAASHTAAGDIRDDFQNRAIWFVGLLVLAVHLACAGRYDFFRNELYFSFAGAIPPSAMPISRRSFP